MGWKDLAYWLKGGIIGLIIVIIPIIYSLFLLINSDHEPLNAVVSSFVHVLSLFFVLLCIFIGFIVGKIKSKKKK